MKVLYIYAGKRRNKFKGEIGIDYADTQFYGLNHLKNFGIDAEYREWGDFWFGRIFHFLSFNIKHALMFFATRGHDVVFGSSILNMMFFKKIFGSRTSKFILLNISLKRLWQGNQNRPFKKFLLNWLLKELDGVVCLSMEQISFCTENFPYLRGKIFFVPLGVDTIYNKFVQEGRENFILSAGRDNARDYRTVLAVARSLPDRNFEIVASKRNLKDIGEIPANVNSRFDISPSELAEKYRKAQLLLLLTHPDSFKEGADGSGQTVLLEAFASGLPVVATARGSLRDYVVDGHTALLSDFYDTQGIIGNIKKMEDKELRNTLARNARVVAEEKSSSVRMAEKLSEVFKKVVCNK